MMDSEESKRPRWVSVLLVVLPLWLVLSGAGAMWYFRHRETRAAEEEQARFVQAVSAPLLKDDLRKFVEVIGERNGASDPAAKNLGRTASMIEGLLGPSNTGYEILRTKGPSEWPLLQVTVKRKKPESPAIWVVSSYDSKPGSRGAEANASGLAATLATAQALAGDEPEMNIHFVFVPHANDPDSPILETATAFKALAVSPKAVFCVEAMGAGEPLWLSSRETDAIAPDLVQGLGSIRGSEVVCLGDDVDFASVLFEMGIPAVRVSTRPLVEIDEKDDQLPDAQIVAASTGRLIELIRRCSASR